MARPIKPTPRAAEMMAASETRRAPDAPSAAPGAVSLDAARAARAAAIAAAPEDWRAARIAAVKASRRFSADLARDRRAATAPREARVVKDALAIGAIIDGPTPEREAKGAFAVTRRRDDKRIVHVVSDEGHSLVKRLHRAGKLDDDQVEAANRYFALWRAASPDRGVCAFVNDPVQGGGGDNDPEERRAAACVSLAKARGALMAAHPHALVIVDAVVLHGETGAEAAVRIGSARGPRNEGRVLGLLEVGLFTLARHWGIARY